MKNENSAVNYEIRVREHGNVQKWEAMPVWETFTGSKEDVTCYAQLIAGNRKVDEVRVNALGSLQGFYYN